MQRVAAILTQRKQREKVKAWPAEHQAMSSRFQIHDDLTAPEGSLPVLKGALAAGGQLPNFLGVLAGSPAALRAYARFRAELRHGTLPLRDARADRARGRRALRLRARARAAHAHRRAQAGLGIDEVALAREWDSRDEREAALLRYLQAARRAARPRRRCTSTRRRARPAGPTSSCSRRSRCVALESFTAMVNVAGEVPVDGSVEETRALRAA